MSYFGQDQKEKRPSNHFKRHKSFVRSREDNASTHSDLGDLDISYSRIDSMKAPTRKTSVILAESGKKVQGVFTYGMDDSGDVTIDGMEVEEGEYEEENDPLLATSLPDLNSEPWVARKVKELSHFQLSKTQKGVLKSSIAYFLASLSVYCTPISNLLGKIDSKHVVCTVCVYFHATRTKGSMIESMGFAILGVSFAFLTSIISMTISTFYFDQGHRILSIAIDLLVSSIALGLISFMKQRVDKPNFNVACSLSAISLISCIVKEGSLNSAQVPVEKIRYLLAIVFMGSFVSCIVCFLLWPTSAITELRTSLNECCNDMSQLLRVLPNKFVTIDSVDSEDVNQLYSSLNNNMKKVYKSLNEAKYELYVRGKEKEFKHFSEMAHSLVKMSGSLSGLKTSAEMQWALLHDETEAATFVNDVSLDEFMGKSLRKSRIDEDPLDADHHFVALNSAELFKVFIFYLGPSMKSFSFTMRQVLDGVPFENKQVQLEITNTAPFQHSLKLASDLFNSRHMKALNRLYGQKLFTEDADVESKINQEEVAASCGNFAALLSDFSNELSGFLSVLDEYRILVDSKSYEFLKFWKRTPNNSYQAYTNKNGSRPTVTLNDALLKLQNVKTTENSVQSGSLSFNLWRLLRFFQRVDVQFGFKVGIGAFCISLWAFVEETKAIFSEWKGEWVLVTYCIIMNKSVGGTAMTINWRFLGTFLGAFSAYAAWYIFEGEVFGLALAGFLISVPSFYIILQWKTNNAFGRFILLTYNLTVLYSYSLSRNDYDSGEGDDEEGGTNPLVSDIAMHRFFGVSLGVVWAMVITLLFFPNSARSRLRKGLCVLWLRMGIIWNSDPLSYKYDEFTQENKMVGIADRKAIRRIIAELEVCLKQAPKELRLKGPFPQDIYTRLLKSTHKIMDAFENMNSIIDVDPMITENEKDVITYIQSERSELEHRVFLIFYMVASAIRLGFPLASKPASTEHAKDRMLAKLSEIRHRVTKDNENSMYLTNQDFVLLYSYILVTSTITEELDKIIADVIDLFGIVTEETFDI
ncbi:BA75_04157T0 [Komagataella pastoris]|uniref:BA75_04157T0 n=1 Tax=Komagataella pastoris TaxID=4922 RepID=A0A1B2JGU0_PICPA|nr:BA75_04157T0 [Komagataella pastoris]